MDVSRYPNELKMATVSDVANHLIQRSVQNARKTIAKFMRVKSLLHYPNEIGWRSGALWRHKSGHHWFS